MEKKQEIKKYCNEILWSDIIPCEVVEVKTARKVIIRRMEAVIDPSFKPEVIPGGFCGHVVNQDDQKWIYTSNADNPTFAVRWSAKKNRWQCSGGNHYSMSDRPIKKYDYNF